MCVNRGIDFNWSFEKYCQAAHYDSALLQAQLYQDFPQLKLEDPSWKILYGEKQQIIHDLLSQGAVELMPGVASLLRGT